MVYNVGMIEKLNDFPKTPRTPNHGLELDPLGKAARSEIRGSGV